MVRTTKASRKKRVNLRPSAVTPPEDDATLATDSTLPIVEHPDGYYWLTPDSHQQVGPFETYELAQADRDAVADEALSPDDSVQEAAREAGIADWVDAELGELGEGGSPPHLQEE